MMVHWEDLTQGIMDGNCPRDYERGRRGDDLVAANDAGRFSTSNIASDRDPLESVRETHAFPTEAGGAD